MYKLTYLVKGPDKSFCLNFLPEMAIELEKGANLEEIFPSDFMKKHFLQYENIWELLSSMPRSISERDRVNNYISTLNKPLEKIMNTIAAIESRVRPLARFNDKGSLLVDNPSSVVISDREAIEIDEELFETCIRKETGFSWREIQLKALEKWKQEKCKSNFSIQDHFPKWNPKDLI